MWKLALIGTVAGAVLGFAGGWRVHDWRDGYAQAKVITKYVTLERRQGETTTRIAVADQAARDQVRTVTRTLIEKVPVYVSPASDRRCVVPVGFVRLHDAAAAGRELPAAGDAPGQSDDAASGLELSAVAGAVAANYGTCNETRRQLSDLQDWEREQAALASSQK